VQIAVRKSKAGSRIHWNLAVVYPNLLVGIIPGLARAIQKRSRPLLCGCGRKHRTEQSAGAVDRRLRIQGNDNFGVAWHSLGFAQPSLAFVIVSH